MSTTENFIREYEALCRKHGFIVVCATHHGADNPGLAAPAPEHDGFSGLPSISEHVAKLRGGQEWTLIQRRDRVVGS